MNLYVEIKWFCRLNEDFRAIPFINALHACSAVTFIAFKRIVMFCNLLGSSTCLVGEGVLLFVSSFFIEFCMLYPKSDSIISSSNLFRVRLVNSQGKRIGI